MDDLDYVRIKRYKHMQIGTWRLSCFVPVSFVAKHHTCIRIAWTNIFLLYLYNSLNYIMLHHGIAVVFLKTNWCMFICAYVFMHILCVCQLWMVMVWSMYNVHPWQIVDYCYANIAVCFQIDYCRDGSKWCYVMEFHNDIMNTYPQLLNGNTRICIFNYRSVD